MTKKQTLVGGLSLILSCLSQAGETELLAAYDALEGHINGSTTLNAAQITQQRTIVRDNSSFAGDTAVSISASLDLLDLYEAQAAPLFSDEFSRTNASTQFLALRLAMFDLHQAIIDDVYNASNLATHRALLDGYKFESADKFPGQVAALADPNAVYSVQINASQPTAYGYQVDFRDAPARRPTGAYLTPGAIATVTVPANLVGKGYEIRVGAHVANLERRPNNYKRFNRVSLTYPIEGVTTEIVSPLGGGIYIEVPYEVEEGLATIQFQNTVRAPFYSNTVARQTTLAEWQNIERSHPGPWTDFETDKFMLTLPTAWIYNYADPVTLMRDWDLSMDACSDLQGLPRIRPKTVLYCIIDVTFDANVFSPGYPQSNDNFDPTPNNPYNGNQNHDYLQGPQFTDAVDFHEFGHASSINKFAQEFESIVNFFYLPVLNRMFNVPFEQAYGRSMNFDVNGRMNRMHAAINWAVHPKFRNGEQMAFREMAYQHRGYGKYVEIAALFGWDALQSFWESVAEDAENGITYSKNNDPKDSRITRMSIAANANLLPLIHFWGVNPGNRSLIQANLDAEGIKLSPAIYDRLKYYQTVIPMSAAEFRAHDNVVGNLVGSAFDQAQYDIWRTTWTAELGQESVDRIQTIIDLYYPDGRPVETLPHFEDFENGVGPWAQATDDDHEWRHNIGPTLTEAAGPDRAAGGDYYMYAEGHDATGADKTTSYQCIFDFSEIQDTVLTFDYHMYGFYIDFLAVDIYDGTSWTNDVWVRNGQQQTSSSDPWTAALVDLTSFTGNDEVTVRFRTKNTDFKAADPALDNIRIGPPLPASILPFADSYEISLSNAWVQPSDVDSIFLLNSGATPTLNTGPTIAADGSNYLYAEGDAKTAGIERRFNFSHASEIELSFDYHMYGSDIDYLVVELFDGTTWTEVWRRDGQQQLFTLLPWLNATVDLAAYSDLPSVRIRFRSGQLLGDESDVAIDNFSLSGIVEAIPPVVDDVIVHGNQDEEIVITLSGSDFNEDDLTYTVDNPPSNGTLSGNGPDLIYFANAGFCRVGHLHLHCQRWGIG